jgi:hypothetical protein
MRIVRTKRTCTINESAGLVNLTETRTEIDFHVGRFLQKVQDGFYDLMGLFVPKVCAV